MIALFAVYSINWCPVIVSISHILSLAVISSLIGVRLRLRMSFMVLTHSTA